MYAYDSRKISKGDTYLCLPGGDKYIEHAYQNGAISHAHINRADLADLARVYFNQADASLFIIGITGTNGKTSIAHTVHHALETLGKKSLLIGTLTQPLTTPESWDLFSLFNEHLSTGGTHVVMEVSSHGIAQQRIKNIDFNIKCLSNISHDHLDYHGTFSAYKQTKYAFMKQGHAHCVFPKDAIQQRLPFQSPLMGSFNVRNMKAAFKILKYAGFTETILAPVLSKTPGIPGRFEAIKNTRNKTIFVDFAHTPDGLACILKEGRKLAQKKGGNLLVLFGCGGNRDQKKRAKMGQVADHLADLIILSNDNPRFESPDVIIQDIMQGIHATPSYIEQDRAAAICWSISKTSTKDILIIAGKGHETTQIIKTHSAYFSDQESVRACLLALKA